MFYDSKDLTELALDLTNISSEQDRFERLLATIRKLFKCDASALLAFKGGQFSPLAINGLSQDVLGRRFALDQHPRMEAIARAGDIVRFPADSSLPDPYDGLIPNHTEELKVHACIGLPLLADQQLIGAVTIDGFDQHQFDQFSDDLLRKVAALAAVSLNNAMLMEQLEKRGGDISRVEPVLSHTNSNPEIIGRSLQIKRLQSQIEAVANTELTVLVTGETGVGKELVASAVHKLSLRSQAPLIYLNCAALPESVAESELFGHVKGAFTGAVSNRSGKFELADKGTLFLDEIGELSLSLQAKLLRVLQSGDLQRVGDDRRLQVDVRIIAATNRDLNKEVVANNFRADLYHRLSVFPLPVPPLRERDNDILLLAGFFIERCRTKLGLMHLSLAERCQSRLLDYAWPGNVRELEHSIYRASILARAETRDIHVIIQDHHFDISGGNAGSVNQFSTGAAPDQKKTLIELTLKDATEQFQRRYIKQALQQNENNWTAAARTLCVDVGNLHRLAKRLGMK
ncbi:nitric oxide reductase transcriptional regulator NorR [Psychromonas ossibalaenae]|uniref:nitric oxide reductase transcriptional regulator NorR n=1 Tax=Psychromonas ossibalaenae TaxID=444922 RepID=UPI00036FC9D5|nr:nitric oxide reductase transcriptional regulator NorR [Psychromonas ossibalaenae]